MTQWQPIETAPTDGTRFIVKGEITGEAENRNWGIAFFYVGVLWSDELDTFQPVRNPKRWLPIPPDEESGKE